MVATALPNRSVLDAQRYEAWQHYEREMARLDEVTDAAERLAAPMHTIFEYSFNQQGELCFMGEPIEGVFVRGLQAAQELAQEHPDLAFEVRRRGYELQEYYDAVRFGLAANMPEDVMMVISPVPEAVLQGSQIDGYSRERKKCMVRIYQRTPNGVSIASLSLDGSDARAMRAVAAAFGGSIDDGSNDEQILQQRFLVRSSALGKDPHAVARRAYDGALQRYYGGEWYAGRRNNVVRNTYEFILQHPDLIDRHMQSISHIQSLAIGGPKQQELLKRARYNFAAALSEVMEGATSSRDVDLGAAGDRALRAGKEFDPECPTGVRSAEDAVALTLGRAEVHRAESCPQCHAKHITYIIDGERISGSCGCWKDICSGDSYTAPQPTPKAAVATEVPAQLEAAEAPATPERLVIHGDEVVAVMQIAIGGTKKVWKSLQSGRMYGEDLSEYHG